MSYRLSALMGIFASALAICAFLPGCQSEENSTKDRGPSPAPGFSPEVLSEWKKWGAREVWLGISSNGQLIVESQLCFAADALPAFSLRMRSPDKPPSLPAPGMDFGLSTSFHEAQCEAYWRELSRFKRLRYLEVSSWEKKQITDATLKHIVQVEGLYALDLSGSAVSDKGLKELAALTHLKLLSLSFTNVTLSAEAEEGLDALACLTNLRILNVAHNRLDRYAIARLSKLPCLEELHLDGIELSPAMIDELGKLKSVNALGLTKTSMDDNGLLQLARFPKLRRLNLAQTKITDAGLLNLAKLHDLESLNLWATAITDEGVRHLGALRNLKSLDLSSTQISNAGLRELTSLQNLQRLNVSGTTVTDDGLAELAKLPRLKNVTIYGTSTTNRSLKVLSALQDLEMLFLGGSSFSKVRASDLAPFQHLKVLGITSRCLDHSTFRELEKTRPELRIVFLSE
jgi:Leucine-rich repeat (LRR) protein